MKKIYDVRIRTKVGVQTVQTSADGGMEARAIAEAQYGRGNVIDATQQNLPRPTLKRDW